MTPPPPSARELADATGAHLLGDGAATIAAVDTLDRAGPEHLALVRDTEQLPRAATSRAGVLLADAALDLRPRSEAAPNARALLAHPHPDFALALILARFDDRPPSPPGVHPSAIVHPDARVDPTASVGPHAVIGPHASVGPRTVIHPGVVIGHRCSVGADCTIFPNVVIGADGFGFTPHPQHGIPVRLPHIGTVVIHDHVEIGACSTIDRGKFGPTTIGPHTKIDNMCHIGHNCSIGPGCILCGQCGLSGSVTLGAGVILGGAVGIKDNVTLGDGAQVGARSGVMHDIPPGEKWFGYPAHKGSTAMRNYAAFFNLADYLRRFRRLATRLDADLPAE